MLREELARDFAGSPSAVACRFEACCFAYQVSALYNHFSNIGCLYSKSADRKTSSAF